VVDVFDQVEEELRSDRYKRLARTWLPVLGGILLIALAAALAWWGWQSYQTQRADKASIAYQRGLEALQADNAVGAGAAFLQAEKEGNAAYKALALNQRAGIAANEGRVPEAVELFDQAARSARDPLLADFAALKAAWLVMDTAPLAEVTKRLEPLTKENRPFRPFAQEAMAMAQIQHGQTAQARSTLTVLKNALDTPQIVSQRAQAALESIEAGTAANISLIVRDQASRESQARQAQPTPVGSTVATSRETGVPAPSPATRP